MTKQPATQPPALPTYADVVAAASRLAGVAHRTPVITSRTVNDEFGAEVFFKCENLQRMGAFKFRGAYNALAQFSPAQRKAGVILALPADGHGRRPQRSTAPALPDPTKSMTRWCVAHFPGVASKTQHVSHLQ